MLKVENIEVYGWEAAIRGMRNPLNSWSKSDSDFPPEGKCDVGENDIDLMNRLYKAGTEHRKYLRMITATMDITAPLYWWKEFDTYKVGTVANSCSTMHKIHAKEFTLDDFSHEHLIDRQEEKEYDVWIPYGGEYDDAPIEVLEYLIDGLNVCREKFLKAKENGADDFTLKRYWWQMIQLLPSSYNQRRTVQMSYENVMAMIKQRENHKLDEWREFVGILKDLPYIREITGKENEDAVL
jgi:hypothetical protein